MDVPCLCHSCRLLPEPGAVVEFGFQPIRRRGQGADSGVGLAAVAVLHALVQIHQGVVHPGVFVPGEPQMAEALLDIAF